MAVTKGIHEQDVYDLADLAGATIWFPLDDSDAEASGRVSLDTVLAYIAANDRDADEDDLGTLDEPTTIDFDTGDYWNKKFVADVGELELTLAATQNRSYEFKVKQDAVTGGRTLDITNATWRGAPEQPAAAPNAESLYRVRKSGSTYFVSRIG